MRFYRTYPRTISDPDGHIWYSTRAKAHEDAKRFGLRHEIVIQEVEVKVDRDLVFMLLTEPETYTGGLGDVLREWQLTPRGSLKLIKDEQPGQGEADE